MIYFIFIFFLLNVILFIKLKLAKKQNKKLQDMIKFFGNGFNYRYISQKEYMKIISFCEDVLCDKYHFIKEVGKIGVNNEYEIFTFYKKEGELEKMKIQLSFNDHGYSLIILSSGCIKILKYFTCFVDFLRKNVFKDVCVDKNIKYDGNIKFVIPSYNIDIGPTYNDICFGFVESIRTNIELKEKDCPYSEVGRPVIISGKIFNSKGKLKAKTKKPILKKKNKDNKEFEKTEKGEVKQQDNVIKNDFSNEESGIHNGVKGIRFTPD